MEYPIFDLASADGIALASGPFDTQTKYTQIAMSVPVEGLIADMVSPRVRAPYKFTYTKLTEADELSLPESRASRAGKLNEVEFGSTDETDSTKDYGLICPVPDRDVREARSQGLPYDPLSNSSASLGEIMKLLREKRVADIVFDKDNYPTGYKETLTNKDKWSDAGSDPIGKISDALEKSLVRPNTIVFGQQSWTKFRQHGDILAATQKTGAGASGEAGLASRMAVAGLFEVDQVLVGRQQYQTANRGQSESYSYIWGKHCALLHINRALASMQTAIPSWTFTAEAMPMSVGTYMEFGRGVGAGSHIVKISESCKELVAWSKAGYFFENAVA